MKNANAAGFGFGISNCVLFAAYALAFWYGSKLIEKGEMEFGDVMKVFFSVMMASFGFGQISQMAGDTAKAAIAAKAIFDLLDSQSEIDPTDPSGKIANFKNAEICFKNVHFEYPTRKDVKVFQGLDLTIPAGSPSPRTSHPSALLCSLRLQGKPSPFAARVDAENRLPSPSSSASTTRFPAR